MPQENLHIIQKQCLDLQISRSFNSLDIQQRIHRLLEEQLLPRLESVFDRLAGPDTWINLEQVKIDAGQLSPTAGDEAWLEKIYQSCVEAFEEEIEKTNNVLSISTGESAFKALAFFLKNGRLPWWAAELDLESAVKEEIPHRPGEILRLLEDTASRRRWVYQFSDLTQQLLLKASCSKPWPLTTSQWKGLAPGLSAPFLRQIYWESIWETDLRADNSFENWLPRLILQTIPLFPTDKEIPSFVEKLGTLNEMPELSKKQLSQLTHFFNVLPFERWKEMAPGLSQDRMLRLFNESLEKFLRKSKHEWFPIFLGKITTHLSSQENKIIFRQNIKLSPHLSKPSKNQLLTMVEQFMEEKHEGDVKNISQKEVLSDERREEETWENHFSKEDAIYISLAGIVIIHPFLPAFFERTGLLESEQFVDTLTQERAVHLFYYLATGLEHPNESKLVLLKLLCGMALDHPIAKMLDLTKTEKKKAGELLSAVLQQWEAMADSDINDLRGSFFIREGKLQRGDMGWQLTVEQKTYDVLLSRLPWSLSPIMHSWMPEMIWIDWA